MAATKAPADLSSFKKKEKSQGKQQEPHKNPK